MENSLRKELHEMIDGFPEEKLQEVYDFLQEDELSDEMKMILDNEYEDYQKNKNAISKEEVDKMIHELLYKRD
ncbi:MAG: hypothetical protein ABJB05_01515 [Parafilimonas sp.]